MSSNRSPSNKYSNLNSSTLKLSPFSKNLLPTTGGRLYPDLKTDIAKLKERVSPIRKPILGSDEDGEGGYDITKPASRLSPIRRLGTPKRSSPVRKGLDGKIEGTRSSSAGSSHYDLFEMIQSVDRKSLRPNMNRSEDTFNLSSSKKVFEDIKNRVKYGNRSPTSRIGKGLLYGARAGMGQGISKLRATPQSESRVSKRRPNRLVNSLSSLAKFQDLYSNMALKSGTVFDKYDKSTGFGTSILGSPIGARKVGTLRNVDQTHEAAKNPLNKSEDDSLLEKLKSSSNAVISRNGSNSNKSGTSVTASYLLPTASSLTKISPDREGTLLQGKRKEGHDAMEVDETTSPIKLHEMKYHQIKAKQEQKQKQKEVEKQEEKQTITKIPKLKSCLKTKLAPPKSGFSIVDYNDTETTEDKEEVLHTDRPSDPALTKNLSQATENGKLVSPKVKAPKKRKSVTFNSKIEELNRDNSITKRKRPHGKGEEDAVLQESDGNENENITSMGETDTKNRSSGLTAQLPNQEKRRETEYELLIESTGNGDKGNNPSVESRTNKPEKEEKDEIHFAVDNTIKRTQRNKQMETLANNQQLILEKLTFIESEMRLCREKLGNLSEAQALIAEEGRAIQRQLEMLGGEKVLHS